MHPAKHTRIALTEFKAVGVPFPQAWANAMRLLPRKGSDYREWKEALNWAKPIFQAHYEERPYEVVHVDLNHTIVRLEKPPEKMLAA